jgi:hypothetical protein
MKFISLKAMVSYYFQKETKSSLTHLVIVLVSSSNHSRHPGRGASVLNDELTNALNEYQVTQRNKKKTNQKNYIVDKDNDFFTDDRSDPR